MDPANGRFKIKYTYCVLDKYDRLYNYLFFLFSSGFSVLFYSLDLIQVGSLNSMIEIDFFYDKHDGDS